MRRQRRCRKAILCSFLGAMALIPVLSAWQGANENNKGAAAFQAPIIETNGDPWEGLETPVLWNVPSDGFGWQEESALLTQNTIQSSDNPGEKPYPTDWKLSEETAVKQTAYGTYSGTRFFSLTTAGQVQNKTSHLNQELLVESKMAPAFTIENTDVPQVLIMHTHTTESFEPYVRSSFDPTFNYRTTDPAYNMVSVGNAITEQLEAAGIGVVHDTTIHDYPSYNGSYDRSAETVRKNLEQYPSIKVVLDIHRDAIQDGNTLIQPVVEIDGKEAAQVMIISGCDDGTMNMPNYLQNFHFACRLQGTMENMYPGLTRPILFDYRHYNQDLTTGSLLIEVGTHGNTLEQAQYAGELIGKSLAQTLLKLQKE